MNLNENLYRTRRLKNAFAMALSSGAALIGLGWLVWILLTTLIKGGSALSLDLCPELTPPPGANRVAATSVYHSQVFSRMVAESASSRSLTGSSMMRM